MLEGMAQEVESSSPAKKMEGFFLKLSYLFPNSYDFSNFILCAGVELPIIISFNWCKRGGLAMTAGIGILDLPSLSHQQKRGLS